jgi:hypothetical protein
MGRAYGEVDPSLPANAVIQDVGLAPRNAKGSVEYVTDIDILRPADRSKGNGVLFFNVVNRGNKGGLSAFNADVPGALPQNVADNNALKVAGDGLMMKQGYTLVWFGWQGDVLPGNNRLTFTAPIAKNSDGTPITGLARRAHRPHPHMDLSTGWFTSMSHAICNVSVDNRTPLGDGFLPTLSASEGAGPAVAITEH